MNNQGNGGNDGRHLPPITKNIERKREELEKEMEALAIAKEEPSTQGGGE